LFFLFFFQNAHEWDRRIIGDPTHNNPDQPAQKKEMSFEMAQAPSLRALSRGDRTPCARESVFSSLPVGPRPRKGHCRRPVAGRSLQAAGVSRMTVSVPGPPPPLLVAGEVGAAAFGPGFPVLPGQLRGRVSPPQQVTRPTRTAPDAIPSSRNNVDTPAGGAGPWGQLGVGQQVSELDIARPNPWASGASFRGNDLRAAVPPPSPRWISVELFLPGVWAVARRPWPQINTVLITGTGLSGRWRLPPWPLGEWLSVSKCTRSWAETPRRTRAPRSWSKTQPACR